MLGTGQVFKLARALGAVHGHVPELPRLAQDALQLSLWGWRGRSAGRAERDSLDLPGRRTALGRAMGLVLLSRLPAHQLGVTLYTSPCKCLGLG